VLAILTIAHLTLSEARRTRLVTAAALCAAAFLAVYGTALFFVRQEMLAASTSFLDRQTMLTFTALVGLYAVSFLSVLFAVLLPVDTLSGEIDSGVMQTLASKPVRRADILLGKWLGHAVLVTGYLTTLGAGVVFGVWSISGFVPAELGKAWPLMTLEMVLLMTVTLAGGTRLSTVTNGVLALGFYGVAFLGGFMELLGVVTGLTSVHTVGVIASLISPADAMWRLASYYLQPPLVRSLGPMIFTTPSVPTPAMVWWALGFTALTLIWAIRSFQRRAL
jgi:ABC-type transport system involved in multi-copper enzyme maturation permease subunit